MNPSLSAAAAPVSVNQAKDHVSGAVHPRWTLVEYGDFECPGCRQAEPVLRQLLNRFGHELQLVFRHFPLGEVHPQAVLAAEVAEAAAAQGQFWPMHHLIFTASQHVSAASLRGMAQTLSLDLRRFDADMADHLYLQRVQEHRAAGERAGVRATPAFYLNGEFVDVSFGLEHLVKRVEQAMASPRPQDIRATD